MTTTKAQLAAAHATVRANEIQLLEAVKQACEEFRAKLEALVDAQPIEAAHSPVNQLLNRVRSATQHATGFDLANVAASYGLADVDQPNPAGGEGVAPSE